MIRDRRRRGLRRDAAAVPSLQGSDDQSREREPDEKSGLDGLVSVVTSAHDAAPFIERAIRSVAEQTVPVLEHIVVDDDSTDGTAEIVARQQREHPHLVYLHQPRRGPGAARNRGIAHASGRYIAFLDSDDWWGPEKVEHQVAFMQRTGALFTYGDYEKRDPRTGLTLARYEPPDSVGYEDLLGACPVGCLTVAYDQETLGKRYMPDVRRGQDWGLWLALTRDGVRARKYPGNHAVYHDQSGTLSSNKVLKTVDVFRIYYREERLGLGRSVYYLVRHVADALSKP